MTPRERVEKVIRGEMPDRVPFTIYECMVPQCAAERHMRNRGLCIVQRVPVAKVHRPNVTVSSASFSREGRWMTQTVYDTPVGTLSTLTESAGFTTWRHEHLFKGPDDYKALLFFIQDEVYEPDYDGFIRARDAFGEDAIFRGDLGLEPLQDLVSSAKMAPADFAMEWLLNRDEILRLYEAKVANARRLYPLVAQSPTTISNYGGNVTVEIIGPEVFETYYVPHYNEAAELLHRYDTLIGCHLDANCGAIAQAVAGTGLDYIEAFTPAPDTDMTLGQARQAWPDKVLWLNFPSSVHLASDAEVEQKTVNLLNELPCAAGVLMGITEDIPADRWQGSCGAIMDGLDRHRHEFPGMYGR